MPKPNALKIETVPLARLTLDPRNARVHGERNLDRIRASLERFGQQKPVVVGRDDVVVAGNGTVQAAQALGWETIQIVRTDLEGADRTAFGIADNQVAALAEWDPDRLTELVADLDAELRAATGFLDSELAALAKAVEKEANPRDGKEDEVPRLPPGQPVTAAGDLWLLGKHRLLCGDSFREEDRARLCEGVQPAMFCADPPYAIYGSSTGMGSEVADDKMVRPFFEQLGRIVFERLPTFGHAYVFCDWRSWAALWEGMKRSGMTPKNMLVWDKGSGGLGNNYANCFELLGFYAKLPEQKTMLKGRTSGQRPVLRPNILRVPRVQHGEKDHNAQKPVALVEELIANSSDEGQAVLDLFGGSGTAVLAAENTGRTALVMEIEPRYCDVIVERWRRATGGTPERVPASGATAPRAKAKGSRKSKS